MSEPRKLNTGEAREGVRPPTAQPGSTGAGRSINTAHSVSGQGGAYPAAPAAPSGGQAYGQPAAPRSAPQRYTAPGAQQPTPVHRVQQPDAYAQARRAAQAAADQTLRMRRIQQGTRSRPRANTGELSPAERQAIAMRAARQQGSAAHYQAAGQNAANAARSAPQPAAQGYEAAPARPAAPAQPAARQLHQPVRQPAAAPAAAQPPQPAHGADHAAHGGAPAAHSGDHAAHSAAKKGAPAPKSAAGKKKGKSTGGKSTGAKGTGGKGSGGKSKKKGLRWWQIALITLGLIAVILGGALALIMHAIAPSAGGLSLDKMFNTPKEFQGKELNFLMIGVDRSTEDPDKPDKEVGDGNTDMIMYVHFNNETGEMRMLQIPRDYFVGSDRSVSRNYRLNNVAKTQAVQAGTLNIPALCEQVSNMFQVPIDGYVSIRMEMLTQLVDTFGYIELYVPQTIAYGGSRIEKGYRLLNGAQVEFLLRNRKSYADSDIGRLNMQRRFYAALFTRLKSMTMWEIAKVAPVVLSFMETDLNIGQLTSFAVSMLRIDSAKVMICQMPVYLGLPDYNGEAVVYPARSQAAELLNQYFRENTGPVDASALQLADNVVSTAGGSVTDPNIQFMKSLSDEQADAAVSDNPDGLYTIDYSSLDTGSSSQPAADSTAPAA